MKIFFLVRFSRKIEGDFWIFYKRFLFIFFCREAAPALVLHVLAKAFTREKPSALADDLHLLQEPKPKVLVVDSEVRGTTPLKLIERASLNSRVRNNSSIN